jgi:tRNA U34 2-thiouridine synthase MnmA/TrmU
MAARRVARRAVVGVSGGVDSSVSALLLKRSGLFDEVVGVFMRNWEPADESGDSYTCPLAQDAKDAQRVCAQVGIPFMQVDFVREYWSRVFEPYLARFAQGGTPNPDVFCNREIKFNCFKAFARDQFGVEAWLATGHYARLRHAEGARVAGGAGVGGLQLCEPDASLAPPQLLRGTDPGKDQSYFLSAVPGEALRNVLFPVGAMLKSEVRRVAERAGLATADKKDSVGICFVGKRRFPEFIQEYMDPLPGQFVLQDGTVLGAHEGVHLFTVGQRARIAGRAKAMFVAAKDPEARTITVVPGADHPALRRSALQVRAGQMFWVAGAAPGRDFRAECAVRYRSPARPCTVLVHDGGDVEVLFDRFENAISPMQLAALYQGELCLGSGLIE